MGVNLSGRSFLKLLDFTPEEISYLLDKGIDRVENGESIDLHADIDKMLSDTEDAVTRLTQFRTAVYLVESTAVFVLLACILILYLF